MRRIIDETRRRSWRFVCYKEGIYEHGQGDPLGAGAGGNRAVGTDAQHVADASLPQPLAHFEIGAADLMASNRARMPAPRAAVIICVARAGLVANSSHQSLADQYAPGRGRICQIRCYSGVFDRAGIA